MADFTAIADVSQTLVDLLTESLANLGTSVQLNDLQKAPPASNLLTLFLFQIREDGHSRNRPPEVRPAATGVTIKRPPLTIVVQYLLTPWATNHDDNQRILGQTMRTLHDNAIISGPALRGSLLAVQEPIHLALVPLTLEDQLRVWHSINQPYRLSLHYEARIIRIDSLISSTSAVAQSRSIAPADQELPQ